MSELLSAVRAGQVRHTETMGYVEDPDALFEAERQTILDELGDLSAIKVPLNRILLAIWVRPESRTLKGGVKLLMPETVRDEDKWQGVSALVVKMGPHCYEANDAIQWCDDDKCAVGDWVMFRKGEGFRTRMGKQRECILMESERGIKMVLPRPDLVF